MDKKKFTARFLLRLFGMMLAFGVVFGTFNARETGVNAAEKAAVTKPSKKELRALYKKVSKANRFNRLLKKYKSICVASSSSMLWFNADAAYTRHANDGRSMYIEGNSGYVLDWNENHAEYVFLVGGLDRYDITYARYYFDYVFSVESFLEDETLSVEYDVDYYGENVILIKRELNENSRKLFFESQNIEDTGSPVIDAVAVDPETYEVMGVYEYFADDEENILTETLFFCNVDIPSEAAMLRGMMNRKEKKSVNFTVIRDVGTENEIRVEASIPACSYTTMYSVGTDYVLYSDPECTEVAGKWNGLKDRTVYMKTVSETENK